MLKKMIFGAAALTLLGISSCKKDDNDNNVNTPANGWIADGNTYNVKKATCFNAVFNGTDSFSNSGNITFYGTPTGNGVYKIVDGINRQDLKEDEAIVGFSKGQIKYYYSTGRENAKMTVAIIGGKINVSVPNVWIKSGVDDSILFSANMTQTQ